MPIIAGIDVGTGVTKAVLARTGELPIVLGRGLIKTGVDLEGAAEKALDIALEEGQLAREQVDYVAATGFGRYSPKFRDIQITEITTAARAAHFLFPAATSVLDIGSQSTRAVSLGEHGKVRTFKTNDKCAAGSGSFIARACKYLQVSIEDVGELAMSAENPQPISSVCAVLAESEIINHVSAGVSVEDILRGIYDSLADRAAMLLRRVGIGDQLVFVGGVAAQRGMVVALEDRLGVEVFVPSFCEYACALGAALLGIKRLEAAPHAPHPRLTRSQQNVPTRTSA
jgi:(R)-2-hydroxyacyl-CoA dehydratese activating ATPase